MASGCEGAVNVLEAAGPPGGPRPAGGDEKGPGAERGIWEGADNTTRNGVSAVYLVAVLYMATIYWVSAQSGERVGRLLWLPGSDLLVHALVYAGLSILWYAALRRTALRRGVAAAAAFGIAVLYGITDEYHQSFVPGRDASWLDLLADALGAAIGLAAARLGPLARRLRL